MNQALVIHYEHQLELFLEFMNLGEHVLWVILGLNVILWTLIFERFWFYYLVYPKMVIHAKIAWDERKNHQSWQAHRVRESIISEMSGKLSQNILVMKTFVTLMPVLGLLGTVIGMIEAFDVLTSYGTGNARALASSLSKALITTMAGLVASIPGVFVISILQNRAEREQSKITDQLQFQV